MKDFCRQNTILHVDMDAFFASVEQRDNPELRGLPVIVGGHSKRGVVTAASYEARVFGVRSAMPMFQARERCPQAEIVSPRMARYRETSKRIMAIFTAFTPLVEPISIDEAFLDITGCDRLHGTPREIGTAIKMAVRKAENLTCSVGIAPVKFLAKIASDLEKPNGLVWLTPDTIPEFIADLAIQKVPGVGPKALEKLHTLGILRLGDVNGLDEAFLTRHLGQFGGRLYRLAQGIDDSPVIPTSDPHSISAEETLAQDTLDKPTLHRFLLAQADSVARQLRAKGFVARTVTLKVKYRDFKQLTRRTTLDKPISSSRTIYASAVSLLAALELSKPVRLVGLGASGLMRDQPLQQACLFGDNDTGQEKKWDKADRAVDAIADKFGRHSVTRGTLNESEALPEDSQVPRRWRP